jgi:hypothetical protein
MGASWALWLLAPLVLPVSVGLAMWWHGRPRRPATLPESVAGHREYLEALGAAVRRPDRPSSNDG